MNIKLLYALLFLTNVAFAQTNYPNGISGCIGRWNFCSNGTVSNLPDVSGNNNNGTTFNLTSASGFRAIANTAMNFNGTSAYALVNHSANLAPQSLTIISLVKFSGWYSGSCQASQILSKGYPYFIPGHYALGVGDNHFDQSCSIFSPNNMSSDMQLANLISSFFSAGNYYQQNQWYFIAATYEPNNLKIYKVAINPATHVSNITVAHNVTTSSGSLGANSQELSIGRHLNPTHPYWFNGQMDEVALFNRALSQSEIQAVYDYLWKVITIGSIPSPICAGVSFNLPYTINAASYFTAGNTLTAQLSDATGSFASPTAIGTVSATTSGTISCMIPIGTPAGNGYRVRIVGSNPVYVGEEESCSTITIGASSSVAPNITSNSPVCEGGTLQLTAPAIAGATYSWTGPNSFSSNNQNPSILNVTNAAAGIYTLNTSVSGCTMAPANLNVTINPTPAAPTATSNAPLCEYDILQLNANPTIPSATYNWVGPGGFSSGMQNPVINNVTASAAGTYTVTVTQNGCTSAAGLIPVSVNPAPSFTLGNDSSTCIGNTITLQPLNFSSTTATYLWSNANITNTGSLSASGTYWLKITDNGCSKTDTVTLSFFAPPAINLGADTSFCEGTTFTITNKAPSSGTATYLWSNNSTSSSYIVSQAGSYWLRLTDKGCTNSDTINLTIVPIPIVSIGNDTFICDNTPITLSSSPQPSSAAYAWSNGSTASSTITTGKGKYSLAVSVKGCTGSATINVDELRSPMIDLGPDTMLCLGELMTLPRIISSGSEYQFLWSNGSNKPTLTIKEKGVYSVTLSNTCGKSQDTISVDYKVCDIWFPSGFTPNGDDVNPIARARGNLEGINHFKLSIFNRWGNRVFYTDDKYAGWDGSYKNKPQDAGIYMYLIQFNYNGIPQVIKGDITLLR